MLERSGRWLPPRLRVDAPVSERHATWLELFFDLVFVVAVAELAYLLHDDMTVRGLLVYAALFVPIWWQWIDFSYFGDQYDTDDLSYRFAIILAMLGIIVLALTIPEVREGGSAGFAAAYIALRLIIIWLYARVWRHEPRARELAQRYTISFVVALAPWTLSLFVDEPVRYVLWGIGLLIEIGNGPVTYATIKQVPQQESHMDERFGLFMIIVLGEAIVAVVTGLGDVDWQPLATLTGVAGFVVAVSFWWLYFGRSDSTVINRALRGTRMDLLRSYLYGYSHVLVFAGITATGVAIESAIHATGHHTLTAGEAVVIVAGAAAYLVGVTTLQWAAAGGLPSRTIGLRAVVFGVIVALGIGSQAISASVVVIGLAAAFVALAVAEELIFDPLMRPSTDREQVEAEHR